MIDGVVYHAGGGSYIID